MLMEANLIQVVEHVSNDSSNRQFHTNVNLRGDSHSAFFVPQARYFKSRHANREQYGIGAHFQGA